MKIVVFVENGKLFASVVEDNGDEFALTQGNSWDEINQYLIDNGLSEHEVTIKNVERIVFNENFPNNGEAYAIFTDGQRYAFAWGWEYPFADEIPAVDVPDGANGLSWHNSEDDARKALNEAVGAWPGKS